MMNFSSSSFLVVRGIGVGRMVDAARSSNFDFASFGAASSQFLKPKRKNEGGKEREEGSHSAPLFAQ